MCGIFGVVAREERPLGGLLLGAARRLAYRGYDSIGCATLDAAGAIDLRKDPGKIDEVDARHHFEEMRGVRGIAQLRWATFGAPSHVNAQPHLDTDGDLVGAHNGNIVNHIALRDAFLAEGMTVRGTNDGESCVHAVERYVHRGQDMIESIRSAAGDLEGDYAYVIARRDERRLYAVKQGSGLVVGLGDGENYVSSDLPSILPLTQRIVRVRDGEMVVLDADTVELRRLDDGEIVEREPELFTLGMDAAEKSGYPHFMLKEIHEQAKAGGDLLHLLGASPHVDPFLDALRAGRRVYFVGCGTSYHACLIGAALFNRLAGLPAVPVLAPQFRETLAHALTPDDAVVLVSQSGETKDVLNALNASRPSGATILGVLNVLGSTLMHASDHYLPLACGYEISVPATKTFVNQVLLFHVLAERMSGRATTDWSRVPGLIEETLGCLEGPSRALAELLDGHEEMYYLGYGLTLGIALEGALKLKEISYAHCEGLLSSEFKHGPLSAVREDYPVVFVVAPEDASMLVNHVNEVACRGGRTIVVGAPDALLRRTADLCLEIPEATHEISALLAVLPLQLVSYAMSIRRGNDPDFPRNLSKTLTVD
ncbi:MAG: glutamine--fructose-6-phosphate transaminase (isomerizing) [Candidatus Bipolaricaulota bacterium]|nr:MAG: glutamine--fructose-6-phosphate transaminase (isomerizing) [Candidatus Bipolaricaulota bacterium]